MYSDDVHVDGDGLTALTRAAVRGNVADVKPLIDSGSDVNTSDGKACPVSHAAKMVTWTL